MAIIISYFPGDEVFASQTQQINQTGSRLAGDIAVRLLSQQAS